MLLYYVYDGDSKEGPFTFEQLQEQSLRRQTLVWYEGLDEWTKAENIPELQSFLKVLPPPLPAGVENKIADRHEVIKSFADAEESNDRRKKRPGFLTVLIVLIVFAAILLVLFHYRKKFI